MIGRLQDAAGKYRDNSELSVEKIFSPKLLQTLIFMLKKQTIINRITGYWKLMKSTGGALLKLYITHISPCRLRHCDSVHMIRSAEVFGKGEFA